MNHTSISCIESVKHLILCWEADVPHPIKTRPGMVWDVNLSRVDCTFNYLEIGSVSAPSTLVLSYNSASQP